MRTDALDGPEQNDSTKSINQMTRSQWKDLDYRAAYARKVYAAKKKAGVARKERFGVWAERGFCPPVMRQGVCLPSV
jgi:hypothetical protein